MFEAVAFSEVLKAVSAWALGDAERFMPTSRP